MIKRTYFVVLVALSVWLSRILGGALSKDVFDYDPKSGIITFFVMWILFSIIGICISKWVVFGKTCRKELEKLPWNKP